MLLFEVTYMSSLVWRSMGSWVSLSMWKRTSKDDNVNALKDIKGNTKHMLIQPGLIYSGYSSSGPLNSILIYLLIS